LLVTGFSGSESFQYQASDNNGTKSNVGTISVIVGSPVHTLLVHIKVDVDPIVRRDIQTIGVTIEDGQGKPIDGAHVQGEVYYASHESTEPRVNAKNQSFRYSFVYFLIIEFEETPLSE